MMIKAEVVPDQLDAVDALRVLQQAEIAMAMVHDEYGHFEGIVTPVDLLTALVGDFASDQDPGDAGDRRAQAMAACWSPARYRPMSSPIGWASNMAKTANSGPRRAMRCMC